MLDLLLSETTIRDIQQKEPPLRGYFLISAPVVLDNTRYQVELAMIPAGPYSRPSEGTSPADAIIMASSRCTSASFVYRASIEPQTVSLGELADLHYASGKRLSRFVFLDRKGGDVYTIAKDMPLRFEKKTLAVFSDDERTRIEPFIAHEREQLMKLFLTDEVKSALFDRHRR